MPSLNAPLARAATGAAARCATATWTRPKESSAAPFAELNVSLSAVGRDDGQRRAIDATLQNAECAPEINRSEWLPASQEPSPDHNEMRGGGRRPNHIRSRQWRLRSHRAPLTTTSGTCKTTLRSIGNDS